MFFAVEAERIAKRSYGNGKTEQREQGSDREKPDFRGRIGHGGDSPNEQEESGPLDSVEFLFERREKQCYGTGKQQRPGERTPQSVLGRNIEGKYQESQGSEIHDERQQNDKEINQGFHFGKLRNNPPRQVSESYRPEPDGQQLDESCPTDVSGGFLQRG